MNAEIQKDLAIIRSSLRAIVSVEERHRAQEALYRLQTHLGDEPAPKDHPQLPLGGV